MSARTRHQPERSCVGCRAVRPKRELLRLVLPADPTAVAAVDATGRRPGRGAYLCADHPADCLALTRRRHSLARALRTTAERVDLDALVTAVGGPAPVEAMHTQEVPSSPR